MGEIKQVNELPVLTYRFLQVNGATLPDVFAQQPVTAEGAGEEEIPAVRGVHASSDPAAQERIRVLCREVRSAIRQKEAAGQVIAPNGDTTARHEAQRIRTGMGIEIDRLMEAGGIPTGLLETEAGVQVQDPLVLSVTPAETGLRLIRRFIHVAEGSSLTVVIDTKGQEETTAAAIGEQTCFVVEKDAQLTLAVSQMLPQSVACFHDIGGVCLENGTVRITQLAIGSGRSYQGVQIELAGDGAQSEDTTGMLVRGEDLCDMNYVVVQRGRDTRSLMQQNGVLLDHAVKNFRGTIDFRLGSAGSAGDEQEDVLLLSPEVTNRTMPVILCQEEDVDGRHGATLGDLAEEVLFYMASRGIDEEEARRLVIRSRLLSVARQIPDPALMVRVERQIRSILR